MSSQRILLGCNLLLSVVCCYPALSKKSKGNQCLPFHRCLSDMAHRYLRLTQFFFGGKFRHFLFLIHHLVEEIVFLSVHGNLGGQKDFKACGYSLNCQILAAWKEGCSFCCCGCWSFRYHQKDS